MDPVDVWKEGSRLMCSFGAVGWFMPWSHDEPTLCVHIDAAPPPVFLSTHTVFLASLLVACVGRTRSMGSAAMRAEAATT